MVRALRRRQWIPVPSEKCPTSGAGCTGTDTHIAPLEIEGVQELHLQCCRCGSEWIMGDDLP